MAYLLAIGSALAYGSADFIGGLTTRRASVVAVVVLSQFGGLVLLVLILLMMPYTLPSGADLAWGVGAGLGSGVGIALLYRALAIGTMSVVAPTTAVAAVSLPVVVSVLFGERPGPQVLAGILLAIVSILLVRREADSAPTEHHDAISGPRFVKGLGTALASGVAFGFLFLSLAQTAQDAGMWPLLMMNVVAVALFGAFTIARGTSLRMPVRLIALVIVGGVFDTLAHALYLFAARYGSLSSVVPLSSLYPASTVLLARIFLRERLSGWQITGICCALAAIMLIVRGAR
jgi:drug/metabolite transporter (DMT)-like permease